MMKKLATLVILAALAVATACSPDEPDVTVQNDEPQTFEVVGTVIDALDTDADNDGETESDTGALSVRVDEWQSDDDACASQEGDAVVIVVAGDDGENDEQFEGERVRIEGVIRATDPCVFNATSVELDEESPRPTVTATETETETATPTPTPTDTEADVEASASASP